MKKLKNTFALFLSIVMLTSICSAMPSYAQETSSDIVMERNLQKSLSIMEKRTRQIASNPITTVSTYEELVAAIESKATNIYLLQNIYLENSLQIDYDVFFLADPQGKTIYAAGYRHIQITSSDVQLQFDNVTLDGNYDGTSNSIYGGVETTNVTDISIVGLTIQHCNGTAIYNEGLKNNEGSFSLYNCTIKNNTNGAIDSYAANNLLYNVICENNTDAYTTISLGAIHDAITSNTYIYNSTIRNNSALEGGGIQLYYTNTFLDSTTIIENNYAEEFGGGINAYNSSIESYATIKNNTSINQGGGVFLKDSTFTMQGGEISYNRANIQVVRNDNYGGGIAIETNTENSNGDVIINDGLIEKNIAAFGGAIGSGQRSSYDFYPSFVKINGGTIRDNGNQTTDADIFNSCESGGGIYVNRVEMTGGIIEKNQALTAGGICSAYFTMSGGTIQDNGYFETEDGEIIVKTMSGGGVLCRISAIITNGLIYGNMAQNGGGMFINGSLKLSAPAYIRYNTATKKGGGVCFYKSTGGNIDEIDYSRIKNNTAPNGPQYILSK